MFLGCERMRPGNAIAREHPLPLPEDRQAKEFRPNLAPAGKG
jgi:hypothetical protein